MEFPPKSELVAKTDESDVLEPVNSERNEESAAKLANEGMDNEGEFEITTALPLIVSLDMPTSVVVVENVPFPVGLREGDNDLLISDVEFTRTKLALTDVSMLLKFKLVTMGEAVKDETATAVDEILGCMEELVRFSTTTDAVADSGKVGLDNQKKELDNIVVEL